MQGRNVTVGLGFFFAMLLVFTLAFECATGKIRSIVPSVQAEDDNSSAPAIEGAWRVVATAPNSPSLDIRETYARGGGFVNSSQLDVFPNGDGPGIGTWTKTGLRTFMVTYEKFTESGVLKIIQVVRVAGDTYNGTSSLAFCDSAGEHCSPPVGCFALEGARMKAEPLSCPQ